MLYDALLTCFPKLWDLTGTSGVKIQGLRNFYGFALAYYMGDFESLYE